MSAAHTTSTVGSNNLGSATRPKVHIYIDNSNIYIEGAKTYPSGSYQNPVADPSWRYDVSQLIEVLRNNSGLESDPTVVPAVHTTLYGSVPPPGDLWKAFASDQVKVHTYDRSPMTGKEKQVDMKMGVDITEQAIRDQMSGVQSEFIIVTGDADLLPAVEKITESGFRAHVWSWRNSISSTYQEEFDSNRRKIINVHYLDHFKNIFGYQQAKPSNTLCKWGKYCHKNINCQYAHSLDDQFYFIQYQGPKQLWRYKMCNYGDNCYYKHTTCIFYHNESERICPTCDQAGQGHGDVGSAEWQSVHGTS